VVVRLAGDVLQHPGQRLRAKRRDRRQERLGAAGDRRVPVGGRLVEPARRDRTVEALLDLGERRRLLRRNGSAGGGKDGDERRGECNSEAGHDRRGRKRVARSRSPCGFQPLSGLTGSSQTLVNATWSHGSMTAQLQTRGRRRRAAALRRVRRLTRWTAAAATALTAALVAVAATGRTHVLKSAAAAATTPAVARTASVEKTVGSKRRKLAVSTTPSTPQVQAPTQTTTPAATTSGGS